MYNTCIFSFVACLFAAAEEPRRACPQHAQLLLAVQARVQLPRHKLAQLLSHTMCGRRDKPRHSRKREEERMQETMGVE